MSNFLSVTAATGAPASRRSVESPSSKIKPAYLVSVSSSMADCSRPSPDRG